MKVVDFLISFKDYLCCYLTSKIAFEIWKFHIFLWSTKNLWDIWGKINILGLKNSILNSVTNRVHWCCSIENQQSPVSVVNWHFSWRPDKCFKCCFTLFLSNDMAIIESVPIRNCMNLYLEGYKKHGRSKLKRLDFLNKGKIFNFDLPYFWYPIRYRVIQYLIGKLTDMQQIWVKRALLKQ